MIRRMYLYMNQQERRHGWKIVSGHLEWPSRSIWIVPGTIDLLA